MSATPVIDHRSINDIYQQAKNLAAIYCPEWECPDWGASSQDPGFVLLKLTARLGETERVPALSGGDQIGTRFQPVEGSRFEEIPHTFDDIMAILPAVIEVHRAGESG